MENDDVLYEVKPKFNLLYELTMPSGKKMKSSFISLVVVIIIKIILSVLENYLLKMDRISQYVNNVYEIVNIIMAILIAFLAIVFVIRIIMQILDYNGTSYKFTSNSMIYESKFLNQTKKTIEYANIKEVEIRKRILDRIFNYGIIIIYTNAEKTYGGATVLYAIKNAQDVYENIESLIHTGKIEEEPIKINNDEDNKKEESFKVKEENKEEYGNLNSNDDINPVSENNEENNQNS